MNPSELPAVTRTEPCPKRLRGYVAGELVLDTTRAVYGWADRPYPAYYVPLADVTPGALVEEAGAYTLRIGETERPGAARQPTGAPEATVRFEWGALDAWFEEDEEVFIHPRSPHTRVDILPSSRVVRIEVDGVVLAESNHPSVLFETGLPTRWYLPKVDVRMPLLTPTETLTGCPYKGTARYWSARVGDRIVDDIAWSYPTPLPESERIAGMVCFWNEKVDLYVDGVLQGA